MGQPRHILTLLSGAAALALSLSACSITETINNFLSSTSGRCWVRYGKARPEAAALTS